MLSTGSRLAAPCVSLILLVLGIATFTTGGCRGTEGQPAGECPENYHRDEDRRCYRTSNERLDAGGLEELYDGDIDSLVGELDSDSQLDHCQPYDGLVEFAEIHANPDGLDGGAEFVELLVAASAADNLTLQALSADSSEPYWQTLLPLENGEAKSEWVRISIGHEDSDAIPIDCSSENGCIQNGPDALEIIDCTDTVIARLEYPALPSNRAFARCEFTNSPDADSFGLAAPTLNTATMSFDDAGFCAQPCIPDASGGLFIEQIFINPAGADGGKEFMVIRNDGASASSELFVTGRDGTRAIDWLPTLAIGAIEAEGRLVLGGAEIASADIGLVSSIQNGPDGFELATCGETVIDTVIWADTDTEILGSPDIPLPLDNELWVRCPDDGWVSGVFTVDEIVEPLSPVEVETFCVIDDEATPWEFDDTSGGE